MAYASETLELFIHSCHSFVHLANGEHLLVPGAVDKDEKALGPALE